MNSPHTSTGGIAVTPAAPASNGMLETAIASLKSGNGLLLLVVFALLGGMALLNKMGGKSAGKIARSRFAGQLEKGKARKLAIKQMHERRHNAVSLYIGKPKVSQSGKTLPSARTVWLPESQRGIAVIGAPGSGKTFSIINPVLRSAIDQDFPVILFDFKYPDQTEIIAPYAAKNGYKIRVFAPSFPESEVCNVLDFLRNQDDALMARQIASVMNRNFALSANASEDKFFADAGDQLVQAILMLTKGLPQSDLMTASCILSLSDLPARIQAAWDNPTAIDSWKMSNWVYLAFSQLLQLQGSEKTVAGVLGTASKLFSRFLSPELVGAFCGTTTLPIDLEGKTLLVLGMERQRREAIAPLLATVLHMIVTRNVTRKRKDPLILGIDELPTLFLPYLTNWLNENRSDGLVTVLGFQNMNQLEKAYSRETSRAIFGGCATKAIFNPQEADSARLFSEYLGDEEITIKQKSKSSGRGGGSNSTSDQLQRRQLVEAAQINRLPTGKCILVSPGYANKTESSIPWELTVKIPKPELAVEKRCKALWPKLCDRLIKRSGQAEMSDENSRIAIELRRRVASHYFPFKDEAKAGSGKAPSKAGVPANPPPLSSEILEQLKEVF